MMLGRAEGQAVDVDIPPLPALPFPLKAIILPAGGAADGQTGHPYAGDASKSFPSALSRQLVPM
jgi:hypothetical protein